MAPVACLYAFSAHIANTQVNETPSAAVCFAYPASHVHCETLAVPTIDVDFTGQMLHVVDPGTALYSPALQATQGPLRGPTVPTPQTVSTIGDVDKSSRIEKSSALQVLPSVVN
jgi:hypothetical protein